LQVTGCLYKPVTSTKFCFWKTSMGTRCPSYRDTKWRYTILFTQCRWLHNNDTPWKKVYNCP